MALVVSFTIRERPKVPAMLSSPSICTSFSKMESLSTFMPPLMTTAAAVPSVSPAFVVSWTSSLLPMVASRVTARPYITERSLETMASPPTSRSPPRCVSFATPRPPDVTTDPVAVLNEGVSSVTVTTPPKYAFRCTPIPPAVEMAPVDVLRLT